MHLEESNKLQLAKLHHPNADSLQTEMQTRYQTIYSCILDSSSSLIGLLFRPDGNMQLNEDFLEMGLIPSHYLM